MADDIMLQLLQRQSLINASMSNGKPAYLFGIIPLDMNASAPFSLNNVSPISKNIPTLFTGYGKQGNKGDKLVQAVAGMLEDFKKMASEAGVMYQGDVSHGSIHSGGGEGGFAASISSGSNDIQMG
jgi:hypothetical protein